MVSSLTDPDSFPSNSTRCTPLLRFLWSPFSLLPHAGSVCMRVCGVWCPLLPCSRSCRLGCVAAWPRVGACDRRLNPAVSLSAGGLRPDLGGWRRASRSDRARPPRALARDREGLASPPSRRAPPRARPGNAPLPSTAWSTLLLVVPSCRPSTLSAVPSLAVTTRTVSRL